jgi:hypothetical protein
VTLQERARAFSGEAKPKTCRHKHRLQGTGAVFYQSVGLIQCTSCYGWQLIRKQIR